MTTYYVSPGDNLASAVSILQAGDTLILRDGTYNQSLDVPVSGTQGSPITIKAEHEGSVILNGNGAIQDALYVHDNAWVDVVGLRVTNIMGTPSNNTQAILFYNTSHSNLLRTSSYGHSTINGVNAVDVWLSDHVLVEDCFIYGNFGRNGFDILQSDYVTVRRAYIETTRHNSDQSGIVFYMSPHMVVENAIINGNWHVANTDYGFQYQDYNTPSAAMNNTKLLGSIARNVMGYGILMRSEEATIYDNIVKNVAIINTGYGVISSIASASYDNLTVVGGSKTVSGTSAILASDSYCSYKTPCGVLVDDTFINVTNSIMLKNNGLFTVGFKRDVVNGQSVIFNHNNNIISGFTTPCSNTNSSCSAEDTTTIPEYNTTKYGIGAYLIRPSNAITKGAEVLYRYQDGVLTNVPLFPWAMEDRIKAETGHSVTWESGGGLWKTLDGVYGSTPPPPVYPDLNNTFRITKL